jgi:hypothetical protein
MLTRDVEWQRSMASDVPVSTPCYPLPPPSCGGATHDFRLMQRETGIG